MIVFYKWRDGSDSSSVQFDTPNYCITIFQTSHITSGKNVTKIAR